jgi:hypothetical protein
VASVYARDTCFLTTPEWRDVVFDRNGLTFDECLHADLLQTFAEIPRLLKELGDAAESTQRSTLDLEIDSYDLEEAPSDRCPSLDFSAASFDDHEFISDTHSASQSYSLNSPPVYSPARLELLAKAQGLRNSFCALGVHLNNRRTDGITIVELPSRDKNSPFPSMYHFNSWRDNVAYSTYWSLCILTNKIIMQLLPAFDSAVFTLELENRALATEICKTWEGSWQSKPIGTLHTALSFVMAYEYCTPEAQEWILQGMNSLLDYQMVDAFRWTHENILGSSAQLAGESPQANLSASSPPKDLAEGHRNPPFRAR